MSLGSQGRWAALGLALSMMLATAGCRGLPLRRPQPDQAEPVAESAAPEVSVSKSNAGPEARSAPVAANAPAPLAAEKPAPLSATSPAPVALAGSIQPKPGSIQPQPRLSTTPIAGREPAQTSGSSTPMLDAALARAGDLTPAVKVTEPEEVVPTEPSTIPAELVPLGSTVEEPSETRRVTLIDVMDAVEPASEERKETPEERKETSEADTPEPKPEIAESPVVADPRDPWDAGLERLRDLARDRADGGGNAARDWTQRERLLTWMAEPKDQADDGQGAWDVLVTALTEAAAHEGEATSFLDFQSAAQALEQAAPLEVRDLRFCKRVLGFGDYEPVDDDRFKAGQSVILYCELAGLRFEAVGDRVRSRLSSAVEVTPASGGEPVWTCSLGKADDLCRRRRRDYYVNYRIPLPETLAPGSYQLRLIQTDAIANRTTTRSLPFTISP